MSEKKKRVINWWVMTPIILVCLIFPPVGIILVLLMLFGAIDGMKDVD